jgi:hypothetical protein
VRHGNRRSLVNWFTNNWIGGNVAPSPCQGRAEPRRTSPRWDGGGSRRDGVGVAAVAVIPGVPPRPEPRGATRRRLNGICIVAI